MLKNTHIWLSSYLEQRLRRKNRHNKKLTHIMFCLVDHFEPKWENPSYEVEAERVNRWVLNYPKVVEEFRDSEGKIPQYTFFYPQEEYNKEHLEKIASLCKRGLGEVEIHLHHHNDTPQNFREKIEDFKIKLQRHGLLSKDEKGNVRYGFIHGNWALNNSRRDGKCCGINNELEILKETGCYADFTLPSAPSDTQTKKINSVYYAKGDHQKPKCHNSGVDVEVSREPSGDLMIIQGPLTLNWKRRKWGVFPRIENGEISGKNPPTKERINLWVDECIHVKGKPDWLFIKVYTHGAQEGNHEVLLGEGRKAMHRYLESEYNDGKNYILHYVTARETFNIIKAAEYGLDGNPGKYRDYILKRQS